MKKITSITLIVIFICQEIAFGTQGDSLLRPVMKFNKLGLLFTLAGAIRDIGPDKALREFNLAHKGKKKTMVHIFRKSGKDIYVLSRHERLCFKIQDGNGEISVVAKKDIDKIFSTGRLAIYMSHRFWPLSFANAAKNISSKIPARAIKASN
jgi:hypothetical protein